jgi:general stress protein CsbA
MTAALAFLLGCALIGLYSNVGGRNAYVAALVAAVLLAAAYYTFEGMV